LFSTRARARVIRPALVASLGFAIGCAIVHAQAADARGPLGPSTNDGGVIPYFIAKAVDGSGYRAGDEQLVVWALQEWQRRLGGLPRFQQAGSEDAATIRVRFLPWSEEAALGRMEPSDLNGRTIVSLDIRPDEHRFRPTVRRRVIEDPLMRDVVIYYVCLHEIGHALGLSHSQNAADVMWPGVNGVTLPVYDHYRHRLQSREDIPNVSWLSKDDVGRAQVLWSSPHTGRSSR